MLLTNYQQGNVKVPCKLVYVYPIVRPVKLKPALVVEFLDNENKSFTVELHSDDIIFIDEDKEILCGRNVIHSVEKFNIIMTCFGHEYENVKDKLFMNYDYTKKITLLHILTKDKENETDNSVVKLETEAYIASRIFGFERINYQVENPFTTNQKLFVYLGTTDSFNTQLLLLQARFPALIFDKITVKFDHLKDWPFYSMKTSQIDGSDITIFNYNNDKKALDNFKAYLPTIAKFYN